MKMEKVKVIQYGCGLMANVLVEYLLDHGAEIVGAIDNDPDLVGKDIGKVSHLNKELGVIISSNAEEVLKNTEADIVLLTTMSYIKEIYPALEQCVKYGKNVLTIADESIYAWNTSKEEMLNIDKLAKVHDVTVSGTGMQDIYWVNLPAMTAAGMNSLKHIKGTISYNVEDYGVDGIDFSESNLSFIEARDSGAYLWNSGYNACEALAAKMGLTIKTISQETIPIVLQKDMVSLVKEESYYTGDTVGMSLMTYVNTEEEISMEVECIAKIFGPKEKDLCEWELEGEETTHLSVSHLNTVALTCGTMVNRIPDVINAKAGYVTVEELDQNKLKVKSLETYIK